MGRRMADHIGPVGFKYVPNPPFLPDGTDQHHQIQRRIAPLQLHLDVVSVVLVNIKNHQPPGRQGRQLTAELAADGTAAAGDQDHLVLDLVPDGRVVGMHLGTAQQVLDADGLDLGQSHFAVDQLVQGGQGLQLRPGLAANFQNLIAHFFAGGGDTEDNVLNGVFFCRVQDLLPAAHYLHATDPVALLGRVVIDEADHPVSGVAVVLQFPDHQHRAVPGADEHGAPQCAGSGGIAGDQLPAGLAVSNPGGAYGQHQHHHVNKGKTSGEGAVHNAHNGVVQRRRAEGGKCNGNQLPLPGIFPGAAVQPEHLEHQQGRQGPGDTAESECMQEAMGGGIGIIQLHPQHHSHKGRQVDQAYIDQYDPKNAQSVTSVVLFVILHSLPLFRR